MIGQYYIDNMLRGVVVSKFGAYSDMFTFQQACYNDILKRKRTYCEINLTVLANAHTPVMTFLRSNLCGVS